MCVFLHVCVCVCVCVCVGGGEVKVCTTNVGDNRI